VASTTFALTTRPGPNLHTEWPAPNAGWPFP